MPQNELRAAFGRIHIKMRPRWEGEGWDRMGDGMTSDTNSYLMSGALRAAHLPLRYKKEFTKVHAKDCVMEPFVTRLSSI